MAEETGFDLPELGPWVWSREQTFRFEGRLVRQVERYFVADVPAFETRPANLGDIEAGSSTGCAGGRYRSWRGARMWLSCSSMLNSRSYPR